MRDGTELPLAGCHHEGVQKHTESPHSYPDSALDALKAEMAEPRLAASVREQTASEDQQTIELAGFGKMRSAHRPQNQVRVEYVMKFMKQAPNRNGNISADLASGCTECSIETVNRDFVPDGDYLLHFDNDGVHHVRKNSGQWVYLAIPIRVAASKSK